MEKEHTFTISIPASVLKDVKRHAKEKGRRIKHHVAACLKKTNPPVKSESAINYLDRVNQKGGK